MAKKNNWEKDLPEDIMPKHNWFTQLIGNIMAWLIVIVALLGLVWLVLWLVLKLIALF